MKEVVVSGKVVVLMDWKFWWWEWIVGVKRFGNMECSVVIRGWDVWNWGFKVVVVINYDLK